MPANVDIATQEIVHMAELADPHRKRTLGVLTKPDLVDKGAEDKVCPSEMHLRLVLTLEGLAAAETRFIQSWICSRLQSLPTGL